MESDVLLLNEIGLDPGIDHCSAISLISRLQAQNKKVVSFISFCGGLPAPDVEDMGPLKYKFSWSPRGVLTAALNSAKFRLFGEVRSPGFEFEDFVSCLCSSGKEYIRCQSVALVFSSGACDALSASRRLREQG